METEAELVAEGKAVEAIGYSDNYGMDPRPERVKQWVKRWREHVELSVAVATELHPGWRVLESASLTSEGCLLFAYFRGRAETRECGGLFTVPYLATRDELVALIGKHRPGDYAGGYDPGGDAERWDHVGAWARGGVMANEQVTINGKAVYLYNIQLGYENHEQWSHELAMDTAGVIRRLLEHVGTVERVWQDLNDRRTGWSERVFGCSPGEVNSRYEDGVEVMKTPRGTIEDLKDFYREFNAPDWRTQLMAAAGFALVEPHETYGTEDVYRWGPADTLRMQLRKELEWEHQRAAARAASAVCPAPEWSYLKNERDGDSARRRVTMGKVDENGQEHSQRVFIWDPETGQLGEFSEVTS